MVSLSEVQASNSRISSTLPPLVAVFVGATSGIGEATLKEFAKRSVRPKAYFIGRSKEAADRIVLVCKALNPEGEYIFRKADISLISVVDEVCEEIKAKEKTLNILFISSGIASFDRKETSENIHLLAALNYYSRVRFMVNLLPLIRQAPSLRRIVTVAGGTKEGTLDTTDFPALRVPLPALRGHLTTLITFGLEVVAKTAPEVSFIHDYPGTVQTGLWRNLEGPPAAAIDVLVPIDESGERHLFLATSAMFPPKTGGVDGVAIEDELKIAIGTSGDIGSGVYSVDWNCKSASTAVLGLLASLRDIGVADDVWKHTQKVFQDIRGVEKQDEAAKRVPSLA